MIQLLDRHNRDGEELAKRLEVPLHRLPGVLPQTPFEVVRVLSLPWWREIALWWPEERALVVAEAVGTAPLFALGRPVGVHPLLRLTPPRATLKGFAPDRLLVGHGHTLEQGAAQALAEALGAARSDLPKLALKLPALVRS